MTCTLVHDVEQTIAQLGIDYVYLAYSIIQDVIEAKSITHVPRIFIRNALKPNFKVRLNFSHFEFTLRKNAQWAGLGYI